MRRLAILPLAFALGGCGASTVRVAIAPTVDTGGHAGVTGTLSIGVGMPVDYGGRSHNFLQALGTAGGGRDGATGTGMFTSAVSLDYIHWAEPRMDVRAGTSFVYQYLPSSTGATSRFGGGAHLGLLPMVYRDDGNWLVTHVCVGPELRAEALSGGPSGGTLGLFSLPLAMELNLLAAGD